MYMYMHLCVATSNGREFYVGFMRNLGASNLTTLKLWIGTIYAVNVEYVIESQNGIIHQGMVNSNAPVSVSVNSSFQVLTGGFDNREKGLHIYTITDPGSIYVIVENSLSPINQGLYLAYPCLTFDNQDKYIYYVISSGVASSPQSQFLLIGYENDTEISIIPSQSVTLPQDLQLSDSSILSLETDDMYNGTIHQMQTVLVASNSDLTGTKIVSNKPLSIIAGHECGNVPAKSTSTCEPFAIQAPPSLTWGNTFLLTSFGNRNADTVFKMVSAEITDIVITCAKTLAFKNITQLQYLVPPNEHCFLRSTEPILLVQFAMPGSKDGRGDSAVALVSPIDQFVHSVSFIAPEANAFSGVYIGVTVSAEHYNSNNIFYDGELLDCDWNMILDNNSTVQGYGCSYTITNLHNSISQHTVSHLAPNGLISVLVYAFNESNVGVAYLAGQRITVGFAGEY